MDSSKVAGSLSSSISELQEKHRLDLENLTLTTQPFKTLKYFLFATIQYLRRSVLYLLKKGGWYKISCFLLVTFGIMLLTIDGPHEKHVQELLCYSRYVLWWVTLGVASSIGLGSGLHTFVLYLGPHIALLTIKAMQCGRADLKTAPYDTIQLNRKPSWLDKDCTEFGPPLYASLPASLVKVPLSKILPQVQLEAILWGVGTALGELPPYFISRAARLSGSKLEAMEELGVSSSKEDGFVSGTLKQIKCWLLSHSQHLNFFTILVLASVPNPLFDLAGIMCGQFGISFWKFFFATLIGKAIIKTHIQTVFIISACNNQLVELVEHELIWVLSHIPGFSTNLPKIISKLHLVQEKYLLPASSNAESEFIAECFMRRAYITGFTGSAGTAVVTEEKAALWTDGRYFLQAEKQLTRYWILMRSGSFGVPTTSEWLNNVLAPGCRIGIDPGAVPFFF